MKQYRFFLYEGNHSVGSVVFKWNECQTREQWRELHDRVWKYIKRSNAQTKHMIDRWECPEWQSWANLNPLPLPNIGYKGSVRRSKESQE